LPLECPGKLLLQAKYGLKSEESGLPLLSLRAMALLSGKGTNGPLIQLRLRQGRNGSLVIGSPASIEAVSGERGTG